MVFGHVRLQFLHLPLLVGGLRLAGRDVAQSASRLASISVCTRCFDLDLRTFRSGIVDKRKVYLFVLEEIRRSPFCQRIRHARFPYLAQKFIAEIDYWVRHSGPLRRSDRLTSDQLSPIVNRSPKAASATPRVAARDGPIEDDVSSVSPAPWPPRSRCRLDKAGALTCRDHQRSQKADVGCTSRAATASPESRVVLLTTATRMDDRRIHAAPSSTEIPTRSAARPMACGWV
jgi:hypothetical protein